MIGHRALHHVAALIAAVAAPFVMASCGGTVTETQTCVFDGKTYAAGDTFKDAEGCNDCQCQEDGTVGCTAKACVATCEHEGNVYFAGDSFPAGDDCNDCRCLEDGAVICTEAFCESFCDYGGTAYFPGETFPASDGCNTCTCMDDLTVACTMADCAGACTYAGKSYQEGESFPALDGCNTCTCASDGGIGCTKVACQCDPSKEWWRDYVSTDPEQCKLIDYICPPNTGGFTNDCGCGCEQDASCPQYFDCKPPSPCDVAAIMAECPYSVIGL